MIVYAIIFTIALGASFVSVLLPKLDLSTLSRYPLEGTTMSILLPAPPVKEKKTMETVIGKLDTIVYNATSGLIYYTINDTELPEGYTPSPNVKTADDFYKEAIRRIAETTKGTIRNEKPVQYKNIPGMEVIIDSTSNVSVRTRVFKVGNRFIQLMATTTTDNIDNKKIIQFLESFEMQGR
jgi:hypothetical protein